MNIGTVGDALGWSCDALEFAERLVGPPGNTVDRVRQAEQCVA
jgi:hypothetical protein